MMIHSLFFWCLTGVCLGFEVRQSPSEFITNVGSEVQIFCNHEKTDYTVMLWYQQSPGETAMKLIGFLNVNTPKFEDENKNNFEITGDLSAITAKNGSLIVKEAKGQEHSATYYCVASKAQ
ncbi:unnamed protein product [Oreochromis niloticus]|nr:unnamed protein product [Mustela putorius furo]